MKTKKIFIGIFIFLILFGIFARLYSLNEDFTGEETDFIAPAIAIATTGHPIFYHSEQQPSEIALWHPPMYIYSLGLLFNLLDVSEIVARSLNIIFSFLITGLIFLFCFNLIKGKKGLIIGIISATIFLINYYTLSSSIIVDIDVFSTFFVFGFVYFILRNYQTQEDKYLIFASIFLFFGLCNRYPMMILTYIFIGGYYLSNQDLQKNFKKYLFLGIIPGFIFLFIWAIYSIFVEPGNFFSFIIHNANFGISQVSNLGIYVSSFLLNIAQLIRLITLPMIVLSVLAIANLIKNKSKTIRILLLYIAPTALLFLLVPRPAFGYPRYFLTIMPGIFILIGIFIFQSLSQEKISGKEINLILLTALTSGIILGVLNPQSTIYDSKGLILATNLPDFLFNISASLPILFALFFENKKKTLIIILITLTIVYSIFFGIKLITNESHIRETGVYIQENTSPEDLVIVPKAVGYYTERRFYINDNNKPELDFSISHLKEYFKKSYKNSQMDEQYFWSEDIYSGLYKPIPSEQELQKVKYIVRYSPVKGDPIEKRIGDFYIYKK